MAANEFSKPCDLNDRITLKFDRHIGSIATDVPVKFQSDAMI